MRASIRTRHLGEHDRGARDGRSVEAGWFGKVVKDKQRGHEQCRSDRRGGPAAGDATNVVTDYVHIRGEWRSHDSKFFREITDAYKAAFEEAAKSKGSRGQEGG